MSQPSNDHRTSPLPLTGPVVGERGDAMVIFILGLAVAMLSIGGISLDTWHAFSEQRALAAAADAAAAAGASGIDTTTYAETGTLVLDPGKAATLALANLAAQTDLPGPSNPIIDVTASRITVTLHGSVNLTLLKIFARDQPIDMTVTASASPRTTGP
jgi:Flp pilus assembly protein TadG